MKVEKALTIEVSGVLSVDVSPITPRGYVGRTVEIYVMIDAEAVGPFDITIDWGDGVVESAYEPGVPPFRYSHTYKAAGTYTITVSAYDETTLMEGSGSASQEIAPELAVTFDASPKSGKLPLEVTFTCGASGGYLNYSWTLDFGDGTAAESGTRTAEGTWTVKHTYNRVGTFTAKLTVTDALGASLTREVRLGAGVPVEVPWLRILGPSAVGGLALILSKLA